MSGSVAEAWGRTSTRQFEQWYGRLRPSELFSALHEFFSANVLIQGLTDDLEGVGHEYHQYLTQSFFGLTRGARDAFFGLFSIVQRFGAATMETDAAKQLRQFFGDPNPELKGAEQVAIGLADKEVGAMIVNQESAGGLTFSLVEFVLRLKDIMTKLEENRKKLKERLAAMAQDRQETSQMAVLSQAQPRKEQGVGRISAEEVKLQFRITALDRVIASLAGFIDQVAFFTQPVASEASRPVVLSALQPGQAIAVSAVAAPA